MVVRLNSTLRGRFGRREVVVEVPPGACVRDAVASLALELPDLQSAVVDREGHLQDGIVVFHNGRNIRLLNGLDTPLDPAGFLDLFPKTGAHRTFA